MIRYDDSCRRGSYKEFKDEKKDRLEKIRRFVSDYDIGTQEEIVEHLRSLGLQRPRLRSLGISKSWGLSKIPLKDNTYIYELPKTMTSSLGLAANIPVLSGFGKYDQSQSGTWEHSTGKAPS